MRISSPTWFHQPSHALYCGRVRAGGALVLARVPKPNALGCRNTDDRIELSLVIPVSNPHLDLSQIRMFERAGSRVERNHVVAERCE